MAKNSKVPESDSSNSRRCSHKEFIRLFLEAERELLRYVMVLVPNATDARDVVQEAAVALWEKIDQYDPTRPFVPWACRFALNEARMFLRTQARRNRLSDEVAEFLQAQRVDAADRLDARRAYLGECLRQLPDRQSEVVRAHYFDDLSTTDLSARFGRSVEAIYKSLQRTRQALQECIERKMTMEAKS
jgi:RNA polymerase sigma-70 factor (ECF subfamily)